MPGDLDTPIIPGSQLSSGPIVTLQSARPWTGIAISGIF